MTLSVVVGCQLVGIEVLCTQWTVVYFGPNCAVVANLNERLTVGQCWCSSLMTGYRDTRRALKSTISEQFDGEQTQCFMGFRRIYVAFVVRCSIQLSYRCLTKTSMFLHFPVSLHLVRTPAEH